MSTTTLAGAIIGFLFGGLTVSIAAELENDDGPDPDEGTHGAGYHATR
ncbi:hypothetical protein [Nocardioides pantholopis]|nr:hypothetical protein [Nocardioides pantholopis]